MCTELLPPGGYQLQLNISYHISYQTQYVEQGRQLYVGRNIDVRSRNNSCIGKAVRITYSECVSVALVIQHAKRMRHIISLSVACLAVQYFSTLSHKLYNFLIKKLQTIKRVFWFSLQILS
jgi:hypothetical protein